ncbi:hypothetical protein [Salinimicrobium xinjiangense]|uniref:hypothetical protein n=1 Tax=Salinimicrobium xinjiangense TaxID=438596 RepID=UPI00048E5F1C|nr:hypothetical protein [Salinimicrobium xinjiangense]
MTPEILTRILNELRPLIVQLAITHGDREGHTRIKVDIGNTIDRNSIHFMPGPFEKEEYIFVGEPKFDTTGDFRPNDAVFVYYSLYWVEYNEWMNFKEVVVLAENK